MVIVGVLGLGRLGGNIAGDLVSSKTIFILALDYRLAEQDQVAFDNLK